ncbi:MAG: endonuclease III [candidate division Zixibacteria bacterium]|nr:endonuclease III [candidate division Zixibacteria bacterium]MDH3935887.1 endonuclease III [candidate division Zixibacteria bacterium]MDH4032691.1 endonuclease III [candidate division Zixibacteria bacterium]
MPRETVAEKKARSSKIIRLLKKQYPDARCSLDFETVHQLMVATILSAQCTDERVNIVTKDLFKKYCTIEEYANADPDQLKHVIFTTGFHNNKAKSIKKSAQQLLELYNGEIPRTLDELVTLAGVGRKTASVILGAGFGLAEGIVVDTHVGRISRLLKLTNQTDPVKVERDLMKLIPKRDWIIYSHLMIWHGRATCIARRPRCAECVLYKLCPGAVL